MNCAEETDREAGDGADKRKGCLKRGKREREKGQRYDDVRCSLFNFFFIFALNLLN